MSDYKDLMAKISGYLEEHKDEMIAFLQEFIRIESVTYNEKKAVEFLAKKMKEYGYDEVRVDAVGNVLGRVGNRPKVIMHDAHIDTAEMGDLAEWKYNPLSVQI
ncbi:hypothetical protein [endosymbiont 'TC1' of Trimyema compressum]|uniref:hypothetical protein n=1 Tax=endosymbiont 'TC1' of Trimyema compressum TaxID=243899 RepID=UPI001FDEF341|nr:hypothetical protein [endosymbiont 'TC1' of Trimyema compressum]